jgi:hypothetical protein
MLDNDTLSRIPKQGMKQRIMKRSRPRFHADSMTLLVAGICVCSISLAQQLVSARSAKLAERFHFYCLQAPPDFLAIGNRSSSMGLQVIEDRAIPLPNGEKFYQKNWLVQDATGEFALLSEDAKGPKHVIGCGIAAHDADGQELALALSMDAMLGKPVKQVLDNPKLGKVIWWDVHFQSDTAQVMLSYGVPGMDGAALNLIYNKADH